MSHLLRNSMFGFGLLIRILLVLLVTAEPVVQWYVPFLEHSLSLNLDPWNSWLNDGGLAQAFPYGYAMWLTFMPLALFAKFANISFVFAYKVTLLVIDFATLLLFKKMFGGRDKVILFAYWLSPIVILATYMFGYNDLIPVFFLLLSYYHIKNLKFINSGIFLVAAISAKMSMILALPFFVIYFIHNSTLTSYFKEYLRGLAFGALVLVLPFLISPSGIQMLLSNPELSKIYALHLSLGNQIVIYLAPLSYFLLMYAAWRIRRLNFELFFVLSGMGFMSVVLMTPASPGWFIWVIPMLVSYQYISGRLSIALVSCFSVAYVLSGFSQFLLTNIASDFFLSTTSASEHIFSIIHTVMLAVGLILAIRLWREAVSRNDYFRLSRKPFVLGVAGDSGAGKDTYANAIEGLFGIHSVTKVSGDDYHLWDRQKPMWQVMTHLNPMANDLSAFTKDVVSLIDGKSIHARHYDHSTGRMSRPYKTKSNDVIIASGLHTLHISMLRTVYDLSVYLDIDESLRRHFKITRDVKHRGHTLEKALAALDRREADSEKFIRPQAEHADLVLSLKPIHPRLLLENNLNEVLRYKLSVKSRHGFSEQALTRALVGVCGLHVDLNYLNDSGEIELTIEGETFAEDVALAAKMVCPEIFEFLDIQPKWANGVTGLMQLVTVSHIHQALTRRYL